MKGTRTSRPKPRRARVVAALRAAGVSFFLTMSLFDDLPTRPITRPAAIVRGLAPRGRFDPREVLPDGRILTLPYDARDDFGRTGPDRIIALN